MPWPLISLIAFGLLIGLTIAKIVRTAIEDTTWRRMAFAVGSGYAVICLIVAGTVWRLTPDHPLENPVSIALVAIVLAVASTFALLLCNRPGTSA